MSGRHSGEWEAESEAWDCDFCNAAVGMIKREDRSKPSPDISDEEMARREELYWALRKAWTDTTTPVQKLYGYEI